VWSAYQTTIETLKFPQIKYISIVAEGIPEKRTKRIIKKLPKKMFVGSATEERQTN